MVTIYYVNSQGNHRTVGVSTISIANRIAAFLSKRGATIVEIKVNGN